MHLATRDLNFVEKNLFFILGCVEQYVRSTGRRGLLGNVSPASPSVSSHMGLLNSISAAVDEATQAESFLTRQQKHNCHAPVCGAGGGRRRVCRPGVPEEAPPSFEVGPLPWA